MSQLAALETIDTRPLFAPLHEELLELLRSLSPDDWARPTVAGAWQVRDVAAHLLDGQLRTLSLVRDGHALEHGEISGFDGLVEFLDTLNRQWAEAARRLSPRVLVSLLEPTGYEVAAFWAAQDLDGPAPFPVDWAEGDASLLWMHVGREYTELWHHQMQIRDAVGRPRLLERRWVQPLLDLSVRALPRAYRGLDAPEETAVVLHVTGDGGGSWSVVRQGDGWTVFRGAPDSPACRVTLEDDEAWRLFYNARSPQEARRRAEIEGDAGLAEPLLRARSVMVREPG